MVRKRRTEGMYKQWSTLSGTRWKVSEFFEFLHASLFVGKETHVQRKWEGKKICL